jgi:hypothetical protein
MLKRVSLWGDAIPRDRAEKLAATLRDPVVKGLAACLVLALFLFLFAEYAIQARNVDIQKLCSLNGSAAEALPPDYLRRFREICERRQQD